MAFKSILGAVYFIGMKPYFAIMTFFRRLYKHKPTVYCVLSSTLLFTTPLCASNNILLIIADDFGVDAHGLYAIGSSTAPTPTIDELATQGVRFDRVWSNPVCSPTRATILTGRYSFRTGVGDVSETTRVNPDEYSVADALKEIGYSTALIGKWHLGVTDSKPEHLGFDYQSILLQGNLTDYFNWLKLENSVYTNVTNYATTENVDDAINWISDQKMSNPDKPWFMWLAFNAPHAPFHKPPDDLHSFDYLSGSAIDIEGNPVPYYQAAVEAMDTEINRLLMTIDTTNTTIIFVGDNGTPYWVAVPPAEPYRVKGTLYEGGVWVPLIISGADVLLTNKTNDALVGTVDLFSTIIEIAGGRVADTVPDGTQIDSASLVPLLTNPTQDDLCKYIFAERFNDTILAFDRKAIRNDLYKLIRFDLGRELFHRMSNDPSQYPTDEQDNILFRDLTPIEQSNYDELSDKLDSLLSGNDTDRDCFVDYDRDGVSDSQDNCPEDANPSQENNDNDTMGDVCDEDDDNDGLTDEFELTINTNPLMIDTDGDSVNDFDEVNFDGMPAYDPITDMNPLSQNTDNDAYLDGTDPIPVSFNFEDGDVAPYGSPNSVIDAGDLLIGVQLVLGIKATTELEKAHMDLYPPGLPDGEITLSDYILLHQLVW